MYKNYGLISIIVPIYNVEKNLEKCLRSIQNQSYKNIEVLMVNDGSPDHSKDICKKYLLDERFRLIEKENGGLASARNAGLEVAKGIYIAYIDSDDWVENNMIEVLVNNLVETDADMSVCSYNICNGDSLNRKRIGDRDDVIMIDQDTAIEYTILPSRFYGFSWNRLYKASIVGKQRYNEKILKGEDTPFSIEYILKCKKIVYQDLPLYNYRQDTVSISRSEFNLKKMTVLDSYLWVVNELVKNKKGKKLVNLQKVQYANQLLSLMINIKRTDSNKFREQHDIIKREMKEYKDSYLKSTDIDFKHKVTYLMCLYAEFIINVVLKLK